VIEYAPDIKTARMAVVRDALVGGRIELMQGKYTLARVPLGASKIEGPLLTFGMSEGIATVAGEPDAAQFVDYYGNTIVDGLVVGVDVTIDEDAIDVGQTVRVVSATLRHA